MPEKQFYTVELSNIRQITVEDILTPKAKLTEQLNYTSLIPTSSIGIPFQNSETGFQLSQPQTYMKPGYEVTRMTNSRFESYRGRFGC